jgi:coenzyme F420-reducing hydrogenase delta subunit
MLCLEFDSLAQENEKLSRTVKEFEDEMEKIKNYQVKYSPRRS